MTRLFKSLLIAAALCGGSLSAAAQQMGELTQAVFKAYAETLALDPEDYITYYRRAVQYYRLGRYDLAAMDIADAMKYTPEKDTEMLMREYSLQADLLTREGQYDKALEAVNKALAIDPKSYADIYKKGNIYLDLKDGENAYRVFKSMLNLRSRSQEAFFGMARAAVLKGDVAEAKSLMEEAKNVDSSSDVTHCRIGDIHRELSENEDAVISYITAVSLANDITRPLEGLEAIATSDYDAYTRGFDAAETSAGEARPTLRYLRGVVDYNVGRYGDAYKIFSEMARNTPDLSSAFLTRYARACLYLDKVDEARTAADRALGIEPMAEAYLVKSDIELAAGQPANAVLFASKAYSAADPDTESLLAQAKGYIALGDAEKALAQLNEAVLLDGDCLPALLLRAYVKMKMNNDPAGANADFERAGEVDARYFPEIVYKALAQTLGGKPIDGENTLTSALERDRSAEALLGAAIYYAQTGNASKAADYKDQAISAGCDQLFLLNRDKTPYLSLVKR